jgi:unsaturated chondroitin disaccharide hydrolase
MDALRSLLDRAATVPAGPDGYGAWAEGGVWRLRPATEWSSGYAVGLRRLAGAPVPAVDLGAGGPRTAFRAFRAWYGGGDLAAAARALAAGSRFGIVPLDEAPAERVAAAGLETSIDAVGPVVAVLARGAELTGDPALRALAASHLRWHLRALVRPDGSVAQYALLDPAGRLVDVRTGPQGLRPGSTWARSPAWALLAAAFGVEHLPELRDELLAVAERVAGWWDAHLPADGVPRWDFDAPAGDPLDTSAAAIAADALGRLPGFGNERLLDALVPHVTGHGLQHGCYHRRRFAPDAELVWGDHHLLAALLAG